jgi:hypothetical protein
VEDGTGLERAAPVWEVTSEDFVYVVALSSDLRCAEIAAYIVSRRGGTYDYDGHLFYTPFPHRYCAYAGAGKVVVVLDGTSGRQLLRLPCRYGEIAVYL